MNVFWTKGQKQHGITTHDGIIVVRPGWVAFLPTKAPVNLAGGIALAMAGGVRFGQHETHYPVDQWWQWGAATFDGLVAENARSHGGFVLTHSDAELVMNGRTAQVRFPVGPNEHAMLVFLGAALPHEMLGGWRRVAATFDAKGLAKLMAVITAFPFAFGCLGLYISMSSDEYSVTEKVLGVAFWWILVVIGWVAYVWLWLRARRSSRDALHGHGSGGGATA